VLIDTHNHISESEFDADRTAVLERAAGAGVCKMIVIGTDLPSSQRAVALAEKHPDLWATVGLHPHESASMDGHLLSSLTSLTKDKKVVACGEMGLDYYYKHATPEAQRHALIAQIRLAKEKHLPMVIHAREAWEDLFKIFEEEKVLEHGPDSAGVFHCFTGDLKIAQRAIDLGFYISFSGIVTFPKTASIQEAAATIPIEKMLIETDAPFLSPQGLRGKRNEPAHVRVVAEKIAQLRCCSIDEIAAHTSQNAIRLFRLDRKLDQ